jgi:hypothetical protein
VVRWNRGPNTFTVITGNTPNGTGTSQADGVAATMAWYGASPFITFDAQDRMLLAAHNEDKLRMIDSAGIITTLVGDGTAGFVGEVVPITSPTRLNTPSRVVVRNGHTYFTDTLNHAVRVIW